MCAVICHDLHEKVNLYLSTTATLWQKVGKWNVYRSTLSSSGSGWMLPDIQRNLIQAGFQKNGIWFWYIPKKETGEGRRHYQEHSLSYLWKSKVTLIVAVVPSWTLMPVAHSQESCTRNLYKLTCTRNMTVCHAFFYKFFLIMTLV